MYICCQRCPTTTTFNHRGLVVFFTFLLQFLSQPQTTRLNRWFNHVRFNLVVPGHRCMLHIICTIRSVLSKSKTVFSGVKRQWKRGFNYHQARTPFNCIVVPLVIFDKKRYPTFDWDSVFEITHERTVYIRWRDKCIKYLLLLLKPWRFSVFVFWGRSLQLSTWSLQSFL